MICIVPHDVLLELLSTAGSSGMPRSQRLPSTKPTVSVSGYFDSKRSILRKVHNMGSLGEVKDTEGLSG